MALLPKFTKPGKLVLFSQQTRKIFIITKSVVTCNWCKKLGSDFWENPNGKV